jgi:hypothetical protein
MSRKTNRLLILAAVLFTAVSVILTMNVSITQGVNGKYREIHMPLYAKWIEFLSRHYEYSRITKEITAGRTSDKDKALAMLQWTHENIRPVPEGMPIVDDHILNIMIRGYGNSEQAQDVFVNLCSYAGLPAFWQRFYSKNGKTRYALSFVRMDGRWRVFDAYYNKYFRLRDGTIASVNDIIADRGLLDSKGMDAIIVNGVPYKEFYDNLESFTIPSTLRSEKQMPLKRIIFEFKKLIKIY